MQKHFVVKFSRDSIFVVFTSMLNVYVGSLPRDVIDHGVTSATPVSHVGMA